MEKKGESVQKNLVRYELSNEESERIKIVKVIAIFLVVYIHSVNNFTNFSSGGVTITLPMWLKIIEELFSGVIGRFAVPAFFFFSSVLLFRKERKYIPTIKQKIKGLLVPYVLWNTIWIIALIILQQLSFTSGFFAHERILDLDFKGFLGLYGIGGLVTVFPLWYVRDLFIITLFYPIIWLIVSKIPKTSLIISLIVLFLPNSIPASPSICLMIIGASIVKLNLRMSTIDKIPCYICGIIYLIFIVIDLCLKINFGLEGPLHRICYVIGIIFFIRLSKLIVCNKQVKEKFLSISKWTFMIYAGHEPLLTSLRKLCAYFLPRVPFIMLIEYIFLPLIMIFVCIVAGIILKRFMPKIYKILTGER